MFSSDAFGLAELYHLGAHVFREALAGLLDDRVGSGRVGGAGRAAGWPRCWARATPVGSTASTGTRGEPGPARRRLVPGAGARAARRRPTCGTSCTPTPRCPGRRVWTAQRVAAALGAPDAAHGRRHRTARAVRSRPTALPWRSVPSWTGCRCASGRASRTPPTATPCTPAATTCTSPPWWRWPGRRRPTRCPARCWPCCSRGRSCRRAGPRTWWLEGVLARQDVRAIVGAHVQPQLPAGRSRPTRAW